MESFTNLEKRSDNYTNRYYRLDRMHKLLEYIGNPQSSFASIHIAGSKGKGSTAIFIASGLEAAGYKTGMYLSPHVSNYRERFTRCGSYFSEEEYVSAANLLFSRLDGFTFSDQWGTTEPTTFELFTAFSFTLFEYTKCEWAVIETGLGGRLDATNTLKPKAVVLTPIELEHTAILGNTITLIAHLNTMLALNAKEYGVLDTWKAQYAFVVNHLQQKDKEIFVSLPTDIQRQLLMDRDPHGNVQVSRIETEKMLIQMVATRLEKMKAEGTFKGSFSGLNHFFGYEGRCSFPSNFDADYCYNLGYNAYLLAANKCSGYISAVSNLTDTSEHWQAGGIPITMMLNCEERHGEIKPVIKKALVDLKGAPFAYFEKHRDLWAVETSYLFPGSIQYFGPSEVSDTITKTLELEHK
jgi:hypothetical protein